MDKFILGYNNTPITQENTPFSIYNFDDIYPSEEISENKLGLNTLKIINKIGNGSFGNIYKISLKYDDNNISIFSAMKTVGKTPYGLNSILESYIMLNFKKCIYLSKSINITITDHGYINIIQPIANSDLWNYRQNNNINNTILKKWFWQIICAVAHLHSNGILHGDIKAKNILLYPYIIKNIKYSYIKLTDFGLSVIILNSIIGINNYNYYTTSHRAPEVFKGNFSYPADIWALGCTFYELMKGQPYNFNYSNFNFNDELFNNLLHSMLNKNFNSRLTIWQIANHNYFNDVRNYDEMPINNTYPIFNYNIEDYFNKIKHLCSNNVCQNIINDLFGIKNIYKLTFIEFQQEIELCKKLKFNFLNL